MIRHALLAVMVLAFADDRPVVVGALEEAQCKEPTTVGVRPLFRKDGDSWHALGNDVVSRSVVALRMSWTVAFDGRDPGAVTTVDPQTESADSWAFARDRLLLVPGPSLPRVANQAKLFGGWCAVPTARPLVVCRTRTSKTRTAGALRCQT